MNCAIAGVTIVWASLTACSDDHPGVKSQRRMAVLVFFACALQATWVRLVGLSRTVPKETMSWVHGA